MKKLVVVLILSLLILPVLIIGCGDKYSDVKKMNKAYISLVDEYIADLDKADNAKAVTKAMNRFSDGMEDLGPKMQKAYEKHPELKDQSNLPDELRETSKKVEEVAQKLFGSMMKVMPYMMDPEVLKAQQRFSASMTKK